MSYTPPLSAQVHFEFLLPLYPSNFAFITSPYTPPAGDSLFFDFTIVLLILDFEFAPEIPEPISKELLLSLSIRYHGQVYKYWICQMSHGTQQVRRYVIPPDPKTPAQLAIRSKFAAGMLAWQNLSISDKLYWRRVGVRKKKTNYLTKCFPLCLDVRRYLTGGLFRWPFSKAGQNAFISASLPAA